MNLTSYTYTSRIEKLMITAGRRITQRTSDNEALPILLRKVFECEKTLKSNAPVLCCLYAFVDPVVPLFEFEGHGQSQPQRWALQWQEDGSRTNHSDAWNSHGIKGGRDLNCHFFFVAVLIRGNRFCNDLWLRRIEYCFVSQNKQDRRALIEQTHIYLCNSVVIAGLSLVGYCNTCWELSHIPQYLPSEAVDETFWTAICG